MPIMIMSDKQKNSFKKHWWQWALAALAVAVLLFAIYVDAECHNDEPLAADTSVEVTE